jgi:hypothetical protein
MVNSNGVNKNDWYKDKSGHMNRDQQNFNKALLSKYSVKISR